MAVLKRPQRGDKVLQSLYDSVNSIIDYLPTITIRGDSYSTYVEHSSNGVIVHAKQRVFPDQAGGGKQYFAGSGLYLKGNTFYNALSGDYDVYGSGGITIVDNIISCLYKPSGVASGNYTSGRFITLGEEDQGQTPINCTLSGVGTIAANLHQVEAGMLDVQPNYYIKIDETITSGYNLISCDLTHLTQLYNYDLVTDAQVDQGSGIMDHHVELRDFFLNETTGHKGLGTEVKFFKHSIGNIDPSGNLVNPIMGLKVDCTITGGRFISTSAVPRYYYPNTETYPLDPEDLQINWDLSAFHGIQIGDPNNINTPPEKVNQIYLVDDFYNDLTTIGARSIHSIYGQDKVLASQSGTLAWVDMPSGGSGGGGGSGFFPNWGHGNHDAAIKPTQYSPDHPYTMPQNGWVYAWASFNPSWDGFKYTNYRAHVIVNHAWFKVCELILPGDKAYITLSSTNGYNYNLTNVVPNGNYTRDPYNDVSERMVVTGNVYNSNTGQTSAFAVQYYRYAQDDEYETLYDGNDDETGRNYTKFAWLNSLAPDPMPDVIYTDDQFPGNNTYLVYKVDPPDDDPYFQSVNGIESGDLSINSCQGFKSGNLSYFAWKGPNDAIIFTNDRNNWNIIAPDNIILSTVIYDVSNNPPLEGNRINFQYIDNDYISDWGACKVEGSNIDKIAIGVGASITIPARKGASVEFRVQTDAGQYYIPIDYGKPNGTGNYKVACVVYPEDPPAQQEGE